MRKDGMQGLNESKKKEEGREITVGRRGKKALKKMEIIEGIKQRKEGRKEEGKKDSEKEGV